VEVEVAVTHISSPCNKPYLSFKVNGNNCAVKIFKGFESKATKLKR
jgi:hypothetical protein